MRNATPLIALVIEVYHYGFDGMRIINIASFALAWHMFINIRKVQATVRKLSVAMAELNLSYIEPVDRVVEHKERIIENFKALEANSRERYAAMERIVEEA